MNEVLTLLAERLRQQMERFLTFNDEEWSLLEPHLRVVTLLKHDLFSQEGRAAADVALVGEGMLRQFYSKDGAEKSTYFFVENHDWADPQQFFKQHVPCH